MDESRDLVEGIDGEEVWATPEQVEKIKEFKRTHPNGYTPEELEEMRKKSDEQIARILRLWSE